MSDIKPGDRVRTTEVLKASLRANDCGEHVDEFGDCVGVVAGFVDYGYGPCEADLDVRWQPSNLRYAYHPEQLEKVTL